MYLLKNLIFLVVSVFLISNTSLPNCGDGNVYANKKQTERDRRFDNYPKIKGIPKYKSGKDELSDFVYENLNLSEEAKTQIFVLNFKFIVTCEGKIKEVKSIGDKRMSDWTNISEVLTKTEGDWTPAKLKGEPVDCVYFAKVWINGGDF